MPDLRNAPRQTIVQGHFIAGRPRGWSGPPQTGPSGAQFMSLGANVAFPSSGGKPLAPEVRRGMERFFRTDFSAVRIHEGPLASRFGAEALAVGDQLHFAPGRFRTDTHNGMQLLGHELAHVVQQRQGRVPRPASGGHAVVMQPMLEQEADRLGHAAALAMATVGAKSMVAAPKVAAPALAGPSVMQMFRPAATRISASGNQIYFSVEDIWLWLERAVYKIYSQKVQSALHAHAQELQNAHLNNTGPFGAMMVVDEMNRDTNAPVTELRGISDILAHIASLDAGSGSTSLKFADGAKVFSTHTIRRTYGGELYIDTQPSAYNPLLTSLGEVAPNVNKARRIRRLLKGYGYNTTGDAVVPSGADKKRLERAAMIMGVSEAMRNPSNIAHLLIALHLEKKNKLTLATVMSTTDANRYVPAETGTGVSQRLQLARLALLQKFANNTALPQPVMTTTAPFRANLTKFLESAALAYNFKVKVSANFPGQIYLMCGQIDSAAWDEAKAWSCLKMLLENKILQHMR